MRTFTPTPNDVQRVWHVVDGDGLVLGRLATEVARLLRGKHKVTFAPHMDMGDHVIIVNSDKVVLSSNKAEKKWAYNHSGYPGGLKIERYDDFMVRKPNEVVRKAVKGMLPKNRLGRAMIGKLKIYTGPTHPHSAQGPVPFDLSAAKREQ